MTIREARIKAGMTIRDLAKSVGVAPGTICRYEHGQRVPQQSIAKRLAKVLDIEWYVLIDDKKAG